MNLIGAAVAAVQQGFSVFPCNPAGTRCPQSGDVIDKQPHLLRPDAPYKIRWSEEATRDLDRVIEIWTWSPSANIAIACKPSGLLVVDCDVPKDGTGPDGTYALTDLCVAQGGTVESLDATRHVVTGSGGLHVYYRWPDGIQASQASLVKGLVDVRGNGGEHGGYVLAPGSVTTSGAYTADTAFPIAGAPPWLVELCRDKPRPARPAPLFAQPRGAGSIAGLVRAVESAPDGDLNAMTFWAARGACSDGIAIEEAVDRLGDAYVTANGRGGMRQAEATIRSAYRNQQRKEGL